MLSSPRPTHACLLAATLSLATACDAGSQASGSERPEQKPDLEVGADDANEPSAVPAQPTGDWLQTSTVSLRNRLQVPGSATRLSAAEIVTQLNRYDPGRLLRCEVTDDPAYRAVVDALGGVTWGYSVQHLEDKSKPEFRLGPPPPVLQVPGFPSSSAGATDAPAPTPVEIEEADIVAITESAALFYSASHGLLLVDLSGQEPRFKCAVKLPGQGNNFYYYRDHLVAMVGATLLHFKLSQGNLQFVESLEMRGKILDTRRFNDKLVVYTRLELEQNTTANLPAPVAPRLPGGVSAPAPYRAAKQHRALQVFKFGDRLVEELNESLINTTVDDAYLRSGAVAEDTAPGTVVHTASSFGDVLWASDRYFVVTEMLDVTKLSAWATQSYQVCTQSRVVPTSYRHCWTRYETRPNPNYLPPDNSSGDRACKGITLADCLRSVARASNPTIQVPVGTQCEDRAYNQWVCDAYETRSHRYPQLSTSSATRLSIYAYSPESFVRLDGKVRQIITQELDGVPLDGYVDRLTTSSEEYDLSIPGRLQTLHFQNGFLYAIASGVLQVYSVADSSLVRTSSLQVANETLQSSLFSQEKLYLSDFGYSRTGMDRSTLRVIDLTNPGFPRQISQDFQLPGGHSRILATSRGILTIGSVVNFENATRNAVKLGLFSDPFAAEKAYLILATELSSVFLSDPKAHFFDGVNNRLFLPYTGFGREEMPLNQARIGMSHVTNDEIVSDGALQMVEPIQRLRPRPGVADQLLGFGQNTVAWLKPEGSEWKTSAVLEYYTPIALYRQSDEDEYVEVSRLGSRCKLHFANVDKLNARTGRSESQAFDCGSGQPLAYGRNILFGTTHGASFDKDGNVTTLDAAQTKNYLSMAGQRHVCLFSDTPTAQVIDYAKLPPADDLKCYTPSEYQTLLASLAKTAASSGAR